jgi:hypothetical protein
MPRNFWSKNVHSTRDIPRDVYERRISELLKANNELLERARKAERLTEQLRDLVHEAAGNTFRARLALNQAGLS